MLTKFSASILKIYDYLCYYDILSIHNLWYSINQAFLHNLWYLIYDILIYDNHQDILLLGYLSGNVTSSPLMVVSVGSRLLNFQVMVNVLVFFFYYFVYSNDLSSEALSLTATSSTSTLEYIHELRDVIE